MVKRTIRTEQPDRITVYPSPDLRPTQMVAGVGVAGASLPAKEAEALLATGRVVTTMPSKPEPVAEKPQENTEE